MTHVEFEYHFAKEAERFGISKFIRENNKDYDFQSFMLSLSGIVARNEPVDEKKLDRMAMQYCQDALGKINIDLDTDDCVDLYEGFKDGYKTAKQE